jgi:hypothetical protein
VGVFDASTSPPKERYAVTDDIVIKFIQPGSFEDPLTEVLRNGARALLAQAVEAEVRRSWAATAISRRGTAMLASCVTAICPSARS